jgi:type IV pilus assembly protein PilC
MGMYPLKIDAENGPVSFAGRFPFSGRVGTKDMAVFTHQFSDLLGSGLSLMSALGVLRDQMENKVLKAVLGDVEEKVRDGVPLSEAFAAHPKVFSGFFVSMVNSGEVGGVLENVLKRLSSHYEKEDDI